MEDLIKGFIGRKIDITCGTTAVYRGEVEDVNDGVARIKDDEGRIIYIATKKVSTVIEVSDATHRPGFIA